MDQIILEGKQSIEAALLGNKRQIKTIWLERTQKYSMFPVIERLAHQYNVILKKASIEEINQKTKGNTHGGIIAEVEALPIEKLSSFLLEQRKKETTPPSLFFLDGIEDPFNLGYTIRTLFAFGVTNIILAKRKWDMPQTDAIITKSSAGATEFTDLYYIEDINTQLKELKTLGYRIIIADQTGDKDIGEIESIEPFCMIVGGEKRGISKTLRSYADINIKINYKVSSHDLQIPTFALPTSHAAAIIAYELAKQKPNL